MEIWRRSGVGVTVLLDTSAWVEFLRGTASGVNLAARRAIDEGTAAMTDVVVAEVLSGARSGARAARLRRLLDRAHHLPMRPLFDYEEAAAIYRTCRWGGFTPRSLVDCLVAAVAIHHDVPVLGAGRDYAGITAHAPLRLAAD